MGFISLKQMLSITFRINLRATKYDPIYFRNAANFFGSESILVKNIYVSFFT